MGDLHVHRSRSEEYAWASSDGSPGRAATAVFVLYGSVNYLCCWVFRIAGDMVRWWWVSRLGQALFSWLMHVVAAWLRTASIAGMMAWRAGSW
ncbi:hypothetical protein RchiOBHm_Chr7g0207811 [Rosa chinensis]|uniref:Uncharacterized protein n=1 Tax=Rosa chinensis TaxID=74649 RepID=A0A2P6P9L6_ROSCH|nr:hypothetical protein RchiOBHm_Chr7g0207811 [Rosa chinensis]